MGVTCRVCSVVGYPFDVRCLSKARLLLVLLGGLSAIARDRIGSIEFFGYKGLDIAKIRETLPVHEGDEYSDATKTQVSQAMADAIGKEATDVAAICGDEQGNRLLFIGTWESRRFTGGSPEGVGLEWSG